jgi:thiamine pyrophosphokinase
MWSVSNFVTNNGIKVNIVQHSENVTLLGPSQVNKADLIEVLRYAPTLVAVDGGAKIAVKMGQTPKIVVGDFDSVDEKTLAAIPESIQIRIPEQDSTDFDKALRTVSAPLILGLGFLGGRLDHQGAVLNSLCRLRSQTVVLVGEHDVAFLCPPSIQLDLAAGTRLSLLPMSECNLTAHGLRWPLDSASVAPNGFISTSNEVTCSPVDLAATGDVIVVVDKSALGAVIAALQPPSVLGE